MHCTKEGSSKRGEGKVFEFFLKEKSGSGSSRLKTKAVDVLFIERVLLIPWCSFG